MPANELPPSPLLPIYTHYCDMLTTIRLDYLFFFGWISAVYFAFYLVHPMCIRVTVYIVLISGLLNGLTNFAWHDPQAWSLHLILV